MKKITIVDYKHPVIRQSLSLITSFDQTLQQKIADLKLGLTQSKVAGVGIASNQIGQTDRLFVIKFGKNFVPFINPEVVTASENQTIRYEGCLSVPKMFGKVKRYAQITIRAQDHRGKPLEKTYKGLAARIFQHELDHINGQLFVDRIIEQHGRLFKVTGKDKKGKDTFVEVRYQKTARHTNQ